MAGVKGRSGGKAKGTRNRVTNEIKSTLREKARAYTDEALQTLADVMRNGETAASRTAAATALLDRGYGKPPQALEHMGEGGGPVVISAQPMTEQEFAAQFGAEIVEESGE